MSRDKIIRVLIADDHPVVRMGLTEIISTQSDMQVVAEASDGFDVVELFKKHKPDVVLMDLKMPNCGGVAAIRAIRQCSPTAALIVLTTYQGDEDIHRALSAGAQGYLLKGMPHGELLGAIRNVHAGRRHIPAAVEKTLAERPPDELSGRELEILRLITKGMTNKQIAASLGLTEGTIKWYVNIILSRLHVTDRTKAAVAAIQRGIVDL